MIQYAQIWNEDKVAKQEIKNGRSYINPTILNDCVAKIAKAKTLQNEKVVQHSFYIFNLLF